MSVDLIFVGLGNPEPEYDKTRHNAGFMILNDLREALSAPEFAVQKKTHSLLSKTASGVLLIKPTTYMNESGVSVRGVLDYYQIPTAQWQEKLIVVHDDLDLELGNYKIQLATGPKIHNGLLSVYQHLQTKQFWHVRVGVDSRDGDRTIPPPDYVTQRFSQAELKLFAETKTQVVSRLLSQFHVY